MLQPNTPLRGRQKKSQKKHQTIGPPFGKCLLASGMDDCRVVYHAAHSNEGHSINLVYKQVPIGHPRMSGRFPCSEGPLKDLPCASNPR